MKRLILAAAVVTVVATTAFALPNDGSSSRRRGRPDYAALIARLELTPEQRQKVEEVQRTSRAQLEAFQDGATEIMNAIRAARAANDSEKAGELQAQLDAQRLQMKALHEKETEEMLAVLTPEQRVQLDKLRAEHAERLEQQRKNARAQ